MMGFELNVKSISDDLYSAFRKSICFLISQFAGNGDTNLLLNMSNNVGQIESKILQILEILPLALECLVQPDQESKAIFDERVLELGVVLKELQLELVEVDDVDVGIQYALTASGEEKRLELLILSINLICSRL